MKTGVAIATLLGCLAGGCMGSIVRIKADGVFENGTNVSTAGVIFRGTNSFEEVTVPARAVFNLGLFLGTTSADRDKFVLTLQQGGNRGDMAVVGTWKAHLRGNILQFERDALSFCDGSYQYIWFLTEHRYDVSAGNAAVNAELIMIDLESLSSAAHNFDRAPNNRALASNMQVRLSGFDASPASALPPRRDEMLFIIEHQIPELWMKPPMHGLTAAIHDVQQGQLDWCFKISAFSTST